MDQSYETCAKDQSNIWNMLYVQRTILWVMRKNQLNGNMLYVTKDQPYGGHDAHYKEPDACTENQFNGTAHVAICIYAQLQVRALCQV